MRKLNWRQNSAKFDFFCQITKVTFLIKKLKLKAFVRILSFKTDFKGSRGGRIFENLFATNFSPVAIKPEKNEPVKIKMFLKPDTGFKNIFT